MSILASEAHATSTVLVLGGTGACGRFFVDHALHHGLFVRVLTRDPASVTRERFEWAGHPRVQLVRGDPTDRAAVMAACEGVSAVVSLAGPAKTDAKSPMPAAIRNAVEGMRAHGVRRLIVQAGGFVKLRGEKEGLVEKGMRAAFGALMHEGPTLEGNDAVARFLEDECGEIDWTITRPGMLDDGPSRGTVEAAFDYGPGMPADRTTKVDLTRWYISLLDDPASFRKAPAPTYAREDYGFAAERVDGRKRVAVITGANSGLGFETARVLLSKGMRVVCACRSEEKGRAAVRDLLARTADRPDPVEDDAVFMPLDVASLASVRAFAAAYQKTGWPLHVLLCNAGIMQGPQRVTPEGVELQLATNYLGHFLLCQRLRDRLVASAPARVVHVASIAARFGAIDLENLNRTGAPYDPAKTYQMTKLMQVAFSRELNRRLEGTGVTSNSLEPGVVNTHLAEGITDDPAMRARIERGVPVEEGARTHVFLCAASAVNGKGGGNYVDRVDVSKGLAKASYLLAAHSLRASMGPRLWEASEALVAAHSR